MSSTSRCSAAVLQLLALALLLPVLVAAQSGLGSSSSSAPQPLPASSTGTAVPAVLPPFPVWSDPASGPAVNAVPVAAAAVSKLSKYTHIVNIWLAGNSFDYLFGAFPGSNGVANVSWVPQKTGYGAAPYSCLPVNGTAETSWGYPAGTPTCWPNTGLFPVDGVVPIYNSTTRQGVTWRKDPAHKFYSDIVALDGGLCDLYVQQGGLGAFGVSYYNTSLQGSYLWQLASNYTLFDRFFKSTFGDSDINFLIGQAAGQPIYWGDSPTACYTANGPYYSPTTFNSVTGLLQTGGTVFNATDCHVIGEVDPGLASYSYGSNFTAAPKTPWVTSRHFGQLLDAAGVSWSTYLQDFNAQYFGNTTQLQPGEPILGADASTYSGHNNAFGYYQNFSISNLNSAYRTAHMQDLDALYVQLQSSTLPQVVWTSFSESYDMAISDSNVYDSSAYLAFLMSALLNSTYWQRNELLIAITWSDNGALYDHVPPYAGDRFGPGARVPTILVSPDHRGGGINSQPYEHLSLMKMIATRFGINDSLLSPARQQSTRDMANSFTDPTHNQPPAQQSSLSSSSAPAALSGSSTGTAVPAVLPPFPVWSDPASGPAVNAVPVAAAAVSKLSKYTHIVNIWLAGNSFDYLFGAFPGSNGVANVSWVPQKTGYGAAPYSCLPVNGTAETSWGYPAGTPTCWPNTGLFPVDGVVPIYNSTTRQGVTWRKDPAHKFYSDIVALDGGLCDLYVQQGGLGAFGVSYYNTSLQGSYLWQLASNYTLFDRFFKSTFGDSDINFLIGQAAGQPIYWGDSPTACYTANGPYYSPTTFNSVTGLLQTGGTVFNATDCHVIGEVDPGLASYSYGSNFTAAPKTPWVTSRHFGQLLDAAGVSWSTYLQDFNAQYFGNTTQLQPGEPILGADASTYSGHNNAFGYYQNFSISNLNSAYRTAHMQDLDALYVQLQSSTLPQVVWTSFSESYDMAISDSNVYDSSAYLAFLMSALLNSTYWQRNELLIAITWSDNGALYDHVPPYAGDRFGPGARVPTILVSPDHRGGGINSQPYEHLSLMKMIATRFGINDSLLSPARQQSTRDMANSFTDPTHNQPPAQQSSLSSSSAPAALSGSSTGTAVPAVLPPFPVWSDPASGPAVNAVPVAAAAVSKLSKYTHIVNIWLAGNRSVDPGLASYSYGSNFTAAPKTPWVTSRHFGQLLDAAGVSWSTYLQDFNAQYFGNTTQLQPGEPILGADASTYSGHNNAFGYYQNFSISNLNSAYRTAHMQDLDALYVQLQSSTLPQVVWTSFSESYDMAISDSNVYDSSAYLAFLMSALLNSTYWQRNELLIAITWSDNGALYDHVPPYAGDRFGPGARVPTILVSPDHRGGGINSQPYEHLSLMKMIATRFGINDSLLSPARQQSTRDMANSFTDPTHNQPPAQSSQRSSSSSAAAPAASALSSASSVTAISPSPLSSSAAAASPASSTGAATAAASPASSTARSASSAAAVTTAPAAAAALSSSSSSAAAAAGGDGGGSSGLSGGAIAGIVIGSVVGAVLLCAICAVAVLRGSARGAEKEQPRRAAGQSQLNAAELSSSRSGMAQTDGVELGSMRHV